MRGGELAKMSDGEFARLKALRPEESIPAWAFRFLQSLPAVKLTLSGMSNFEQLKENIQIFSEDKPLSDEEMDTTGRPPRSCDSRYTRRAFYHRAKPSTPLER